MKIIKQNNLNLGTLQIIKITIITIRILLICNLRHKILKIHKIYNLQIKKKIQIMKLKKCKISNKKDLIKVQVLKNSIKIKNNNFIQHTNPTD